MLKAAAIAAGVALAAALAHGASSHGDDKHRHRHPHHRRPERKVVVGRRHAARQHHVQDGGAAGVRAGAHTAEPWWLAYWQAQVPRGLGLVYLLLLLQAVLSAAAVLLAPRLRPPSIAEADWQHLVALLACSAMVLSLARAWRQYHAPGAVPGDAAAAATTPPWRWRGQQQRQRRQQQQQREEEEQPAAPPQDLSGVWIKDKAASDSMEEACDVMRIGGLLRMAIGLIKGMEIEMKGDEFSFALLSGILWFKITERYPMDGSSKQYKRRDLRRGLHTGHARRCPDTGGMLVTVEWGEPLGGRGTDRFYLASPDVLHLDTDMTVGGRRVQYRSIYRRKGSA